MKKQVVEAFDSVTMPASCEEKILIALTKERPVKTYQKRLGTVAAAFAAALIMLFAISPKARAAVEGWVVKYVFPESDLTVLEGTDANGDKYSVISVDTEAPSFAELRDGRLYFTGNGENLDITEEIKQDEPFFYTYIDDYGLTHYLAVGYNGSLDNFGIYEFLWDVQDGWVGGTGRNFLEKDMTSYPWVDIVWEELDIPWPKPGT